MIRTTHTWKARAYPAGWMIPQDVSEWLLPARSYTAAMAWAIETSGHDRITIVHAADCETCDQAAAETR